MAKIESDVVVKRQRSAFTPFTQEEIDALLEHILCGQAQGKSVRACALELGQGDTSAMLRYQNKYRSMVRTHRDVVEQVIKKLKDKEIACYDPYDVQTQPVSKPLSAKEITLEALEELKKITHVDLPAFVDAVNKLYDKTTVNEQLSKELSKAKMELNDLRQKEQTAVMESEYYRRRLRELTNAVKSYMINQHGGDSSEMEGMVDPVP